MQSPDPASSRAPSDTPRPGDILAALTLLTRLPLPAAPVSIHRGAPTAWAYPIAGLVVGLVAAATAALGMALGLPIAAVAVLAVVALTVTTGALHDDGLADSADGLWGGNSPERRLEIMRDSRIGTYGVMALILSALLRVAALSAILAAETHWTALPAAAALSRAAMVAPMALLPPARADGLSHATGRPGRHTLILAIATAGLVTLLLTGASLLPLLMVTALVTLAAVALMRQKLNGQTGDTLGATQSLTETAALLTLAT